VRDTLAFCPRALRGYYPRLGLLSVLLGMAVHYTWIKSTLVASMGDLSKAHPHPDQVKRLSRPSLRGPCGADKAAWIGG
jgi:hypothetical protein